MRVRSSVNSREAVDSALHLLRAWVQSLVGELVDPTDGEGQSKTKPERVRDGVQAPGLSHSRQLLSSLGDAQLPPIPPSGAQCLSHCLLHWPHAPKRTKGPHYFSMRTRRWETKRRWT